MTANPQPPSANRPRRPAPFRTSLVETILAIPGFWLVLNATVLTTFVDFLLWYRSAVTHERGWLLAALALTLVVLAIFAVALLAGILAAVKRKRSKPR